MARSHETLFMTEGECEGWMRGAGGGERIKTETRHQLVNEREREGERVITLTQTQAQRRGEERQGQTSQVPCGHLLSLCLPSHQSSQHASLSVI